MKVHIDPRLPRADQTGEMRSVPLGFHRSWTPFLVTSGLLLIAAFVVYPIDIPLAQQLRTIGKFPGDLSRLLSLSEMVAHGSGIAMILAIVWCLAPDKRIQLPRVAACAFGAGLAANLLKLVHGRARPAACSAELDQIVETWQGWFPAMANTETFEYSLQAFPSAHSATAIGFAVGLAWLYPRGKVVFFALAAMAGLQRIVFWAHWPSDVVAGTIVGIVLGGCFVLPGTVGSMILDYLESLLDRSTGHSSDDSRAEQADTVKSVAGPRCKYCQQSFADCDASDQRAA